MLESAASPRPQAGAGFGDVVRIVYRRQCHGIRQRHGEKRCLACQWVIQGFQPITQAGCLDAVAGPPGVLMANVDRCQHLCPVQQCDQVMGAVDMLLDPHQA